MLAPAPSAGRIPAEPIRGGLEPRLLEFASARGALYLDTGIEPWPGGYTDPGLSPAERSSQAFRAKALALARKLGPGTPTAVICQGANPGLVSQLVKAAGLELAETLSLVPDELAGRRRVGAALPYTGHPHDPDRRA